MKKLILSVLVCCFVGFTFANDAKHYSVDSEVYKNITYLYILTGHALPNSAGPWSQTELDNMVKLLPETYENEYCQNLYESVVEELAERGNFHTKDGLDFGVHGKINPEIYVHSNQQYDDETDWFYDFEKRQNPFQLEAEGWFGNFIYSDIKMELGFASGYVAEADDNVFYTDYFDANLPYISSHTIGDFNSNFPQKAIIAFGGDHWNFSAGKDVVRWGSGETGNLFLGGNFLYDNGLRFSVFYNPFKFSFVSNFYPHPYTTEIATNQFEIVDGLLMYMAHRVDFRFFRDKMNLSMSEAVMYQSSNNDGFPTSTLDIRVFNPVNIYHSLYMRGNCNSMMSVDFDYTVIPGLNFYSQIVMDEFSFFGEPTGSSSDGWRPNKMGYLLGSKYTLVAPFGLFKFNLEGVYTDPCLYLREAYDQSDGTNGVSFYGTFREYQNEAEKYNGNTVSYMRKCIGYVYGGDAVVGDFKATFDPLSNYKLGTELFFMAHGIMYNELNEDWMHGKKTHAPSTEDVLDDPSNESGPAEFLIRLSINGSYQIKHWWNVYARLDNWLIINKDNMEASPMYDAQFILGTSVSF